MTTALDGRVRADSDGTRGDSVLRRKDRPSRMSSAEHKIPLSASRAAVTRALTRRGPDAPNPSIGASQFYGRSLRR